MGLFPMKSVLRNNVISHLSGIAYQIIQFQFPECLAILYNPENAEKRWGLESGLQVSLFVK